MPTKLHQVNALLAGFKPQAEKILTRFYQDCQKPLWNGRLRSFRPYAEEDRGEPDQTERVQLVAEDQINEAMAKLGRLIDLQLAQDDTNCRAKADLVVDGRVLLPDVPVTHLLFLHKQLVHLRTVIDRLPMLDPAERWHFDPDRGVSVSEPAVTTTTRKVVKVLTLAPATPQHPAQVKPYDFDEPRGEWTTTKLSGALPGSVIKEFRRRVDLLIDATKLAQEAANDIEVDQRPFGQELLAGYLFAPIR